MTLPCKRDALVMGRSLTKTLITDSGAKAVGAMPDHDLAGSAKVQTGYRTTPPQTPSRHDGVLKSIALAP